MGEAFGLPKGENVMGKLVSVLHRLGFAEVYDTAYGADLTVMEESREFLERLSSGKNLPLFTSCCPAWVKYCESRHPELKDNLSTCRSPQQMFGAVIREYYKNPEHNEGKRLVSVAIMPCTAKKEEILRPESTTFGKQDVDYVLTTTELITLIRKVGLDFANIELEAADVPFGIGSGSGVLFGVTGGVTEAILRRLQKGHARGDMMAIRDSGVRGEEGIKELTFPYQKRELKAAVVSGLSNAETLIQRIEAGEVHYDFVEVMACPGGCVGGGGQPIHDGEELAHTRGANLYFLDKNAKIRFSHENQDVMKLYNDFLEKPLSHKSHMLLHTDHTKWDMPR